MAKQKIKEINTLLKDCDPFFIKLCRVKIMLDCCIEYYIHKEQAGNVCNKIYSNLVVKKNPLIDLSLFRKTYLLSKINKKMNSMMKENPILENYYELLKIRMKL